MLGRGYRQGRRSFLRWSALAVGVGATTPILQACGQAPAPTPQVVTKEVPVTQVVTKEVQVTQVVEKQVTQIVEKPVNVVVTATAASKAKITGNLQVIQQRSFDPLLTTYVHNLLIKTGAANGWPIDKSYEEGFTGGGN